MLKRKENNYFMMQTKFLEDNRISLDAKGLLGFILSFEGKKVTRKQIEESSNDDKNTIESAIKELEEFGYLETNGVEYIVKLLED